MMWTFGMVGPVANGETADEGEVLGGFRRRPSGVATRVSALRSGAITSR
jgi:hypothetical protein